MTALVLGYPEPDGEYVLDTDASTCGVGGVLSQVQDGKERVIAYYSKTLTLAKKNYCMTWRELLAVVKSMKHFRPYLYGRHFRLWTDHASLRWLCRRTEPFEQVACWLEQLAEFSYTIEHRAGRYHSNADGLSRRGCEKKCKQCARIERRDSGPSKEDLRREESETSQTGCRFCSCNWDTVEDDAIGKEPIVTRTDPGYSWRIEDICGISTLTMLAQNQQSSKGAVAMIYQVVKQDTELLRDSRKRELGTKAAT